MCEKKKVGVGFDVIILKDGKLLLGKRHDDPEKASCLLNYAKREVLEETDITLNRMDVICVNQDIIEIANFITIGLF